MPRQDGDGFRGATSLQVLLFVRVWTQTQTWVFPDHEDLRY